MYALHYNLHFVIVAKILILKKEINHLNSHWVAAINQLSHTALRDKVPQKSYSCLFTLFTTYFLSIKLFKLKMKYYQKVFLNCTIILKNQPNQYHFLTSSKKLRNFNLDHFCENQWKTPLRLYPTCIYIEFRKLRENVGSKSIKCDFVKALASLWGSDTRSVKRRFH